MRTRSPRPRRPLSSSAALLLVLSMLAAACGGPTEAETSTTSTIGTTSTSVDPSTSSTATSAADQSTVTTTASTSTLPQGPVSPLNGLPVEDPTLLDRKLIGVKIDNHENARPQSGINQADAMVELVVEAGLTRFIALFHHSDSEWVGPMRSGRPTDSSVLAPLNGALAFSGGQPWVQRLILDNGVAMIGDLGVPVTMRWNQRRAPHNLYGNTVEMRVIAEERELDQAPPEPLFTWGSLPIGAPIAGPDIFFDWTDRLDVTWQWDGTQYLRFYEEDDPHNWREQEGEVEEQLAADTLVVLMAERSTACPRGEGSCVPTWETVGTNRAMVFAGGRYVEGTWSRDEISDWFLLETDDGEEITVPAGRMWIMIYPETAEITW